MFLLIFATMKEDILDIIAADVASDVSQESVDVGQQYEMLEMRIVLNQRYYRVWFRNVRETVINVTNAALSLYLPKNSFKVYFDEFWSKPKYDDTDKAAVLYITFPRLFKDINETIGFMYALYRIFSSKIEQLNIVDYLWLSRDDFKKIHSHRIRPDEIPAQVLYNNYVYPFFRTEAEQAQVISEFTRTDFNMFMLQNALKSQFLYNHTQDKYVNVRSELDHFIGEELTLSVPERELYIYSLPKNKTVKYSSLPDDHSTKQLKFITAAAYQMDRNTYRFGVLLSEPRMTKFDGMSVLYSSIVYEVPFGHMEQPLYSLGAELMSFMQKIWKSYR